MWFVCILTAFRPFLGKNRLAAICPQNPGFYCKSGKIVSALTAFEAWADFVTAIPGIKKALENVCFQGLVADRVGFEPTVPSRVHLISSQGRYNHFDTCPIISNYSRAGGGVGAPRRLPCYYATTFPPLQVFFCGSAVVFYACRSNFRSIAVNSSGRGQLSSTLAPVRGWRKRRPAAWRHCPVRPGTGFFAP